MSAEIPCCLKGPTNIGPRNKFFSFCVIGEDTPDLKYKGEKSSLEIGKNNVFREFCKVHRGTEVDLGYTKIGDRQSNYAWSYDSSRLCNW